MIKYTILLSVFCISLKLCGQVSTKAAPFTAVKWNKEQPVVKFNEQWYDLLKIDHLSQKELIGYCQKTYPSKWKKRFSEDLIEVLAGLEYQPSKTVTLLLRKDERIWQFSAELTFDNRQKVHAFNQENNKSAQFISVIKAVADIEQFQTLLDLRSSYARVGPYRYSEDILNLKSTVLKLDSVSILWLEKKIGAILGQVGDRHSSVRCNLTRKKSKYLPFAVAPFEQQKVLALKLDGIGYNYFLNDYPLLIAVNGKAISQILIEGDYEEVKAPTLAKHFGQVFNLSRIEELLVNQQMEIDQKLIFTFTDLSGRHVTEKVIELSDRPIIWNDIGSCYANYGDFMRSKVYDSLFKELDGRVGYIALPEMVSREDAPNFFLKLEEKMLYFKHTKALVIDIRDNGGGSRDILKMLSAYFRKSEESPWIANVAKLRVDSLLNRDIEGMMVRGLYTYNSAKFDDLDKESIDKFMDSFHPAVDLDVSMFSNYFFMTLRGDYFPQSYYYDKPVYVLMNERSFSAAGVFASALKGMNNIVLVGVTTDGSSGFSKDFFLENSKLKIKLSRMVSFQRNGKTLDGFGTEPDMVIERDLTQTMGVEDTQLMKLLEFINKSGG